MEFVMKYWPFFLMGIIVSANIVFDIIYFKNLPDEKKTEKIKGWLLQAVLLAEREYGGGTGALKLSYVYSQFCNQLPWLAKAVTFVQFSAYVDEALERMKEMLKQNKSIAAVVEGEKAEATNA